MAGRGPQPKDPSRRARGNKDPIAQTVLRFEQAEPPELPTLSVMKDGELVEYAWPARTLDWWEMWKASPQAEHFSSTDWDFLLDTAVVHARLWSGEMSAAAELRLRVAKFGATPEDRARLRMQFAQADEADGKRPNAGERSRQRYGELRVLPGSEDQAKEA
ncbi:phage terminase small subunit [Streptomyces sp. NPDC055642]